MSIYREIETECNRGRWKGKGRKGGGRYKKGRQGRRQAGRCQGDRILVQKRA